LDPVGLALAAVTSVALTSATATLTAAKA